MSVLSTSHVPPGRVFAPLMRCSINQLAIVVLITILHHSTTQSGGARYQDVGWDLTGPYMTRQPAEWLVGSGIAQSSVKNSIQILSRELAKPSHGRRAFYPQIFFKKKKSKKKKGIFGKLSGKIKRPMPLKKGLLIGGGLLGGAALLGGAGALISKLKGGSSKETVKPAPIDEEAQEKPNDVTKKSVDETVPSKPVGPVASRDAASPGTVTNPPPIAQPINENSIWSTKKKLLVILLPISCGIFLLLMLVSVCLLCVPSSPSEAEYKMLNSKSFASTAGLNTLHMTMNNFDPSQTVVPLQNVGGVNPDDL